MTGDKALQSHSFRDRTRHRKYNRLTGGDGAKDNTDVRTHSRDSNVHYFCRHVDEIVLAGGWIIVIHAIQGYGSRVSRWKDELGLSTY